MMRKVFIEGYPEKLYSRAEIITQKVSKEGWEVEGDGDSCMKVIDNEGNERSLITVNEDSFDDDEDRVVYIGSSEDEIYDALEECLESRIGADDRKWLDIVFELNGRVSGHYQVLDIHHNLTKLDDDMSVKATEAFEEWGLEVQERKDARNEEEYCTATYDSQDAEKHAFVVDDLLNQVYGKDLTDILRLRLRTEGKVYVLE